MNEYVERELRSVIADDNPEKGFQIMKTANRECDVWYKKPNLRPVDMAIEMDSYNCAYKWIPEASKRGPPDWDLGGAIAKIDKARKHKATKVIDLLLDRTGNQLSLQEKISGGGYGEQQRVVRVKELLFKFIYFGWSARVVERVVTCIGMVPHPNAPYWVAVAHTNDTDVMDVLVKYGYWSGKPRGYEMLLGYQMLNTLTADFTKYFDTYHGDPDRPWIGGIDDVNRPYGKYFKDVLNYLYNLHKRSAGDSSESLDEWRRLWAQKLNETMLRERRDTKPVFVQHKQYLITHDPHRTWDQFVPFLVWNRKYCYEDLKQSLENTVPAERIAPVLLDHKVFAGGENADLIDICYVGCSSPDTLMLDVIQQTNVSKCKCIQRLHERHGVAIPDSLSCESVPHSPVVLEYLKDNNKDLIIPDDVVEDLRTQALRKDDSYLWVVIRRFMSHEKESSDLLKEMVDYDAPRCILQLFQIFPDMIVTEETLNTVKQDCSNQTKVLIYSHGKDHCDLEIHHIVNNDDNEDKLSSSEMSSTDEESSDNNSSFSESLSS